MEPSDDGRSRPLLGLSRAGARKRVKQVASSPDKKRTKRVAKPSAAHRTSPQFRVPIPSSFVDNLEQRQRDFLESSDEDEKKKSSMTAKRKSHKTELRRRLEEAKLKLSQRLDVCETIMEEENSEIDDSSSEKEKARSSGATEERAKAPRNGQQNDEKTAVICAVQACFREVSDPNTICLREFMDHVAKRLQKQSLSTCDRKIAKDHLKKLLISCQKEQESPGKLLSVIEEVIEEVSSRDPYLKRCTQKAVIWLIQKRLRVPMSERARIFVTGQVKTIIANIKRSENSAKSPELPIGDMDFAVSQPSNTAAKTTSTNEPFSSEREDPSIGFGLKLGNDSLLKENLDRPPTFSNAPKDSRFAATSDKPNSKGSLSNQRTAESTNVTIHCPPATNESDLALSDGIFDDTFTPHDPLSENISCESVTEDANMAPSLHKKCDIVDANTKNKEKHHKSARSNQTDQCSGDQSKRQLENQGSDRLSSETMHGPTADCVRPKEMIEQDAAPKPKAPPRRRTRAKKPIESTDVALEPAPKRARKQGSARTCTLCSKCPCTINLRTSSGPVAPADGLAQTDGAIEKVLIKRLAKLETVSDQYEEQTEAVRRRLKKHRREMWKKRESLLRRSGKQLSKEKSTYFLPDADELDNQFASRERSKNAKHSVARAKSRVFNKKGSSKQSTLTQMMHDDEDETEDEDTIVTSEETHEDRESTDKVDAEVEEDEAAFSDLQVPVRRVLPTEENNGTCLWDGVKSGGFQCEWDRLFDEEDDDNGGVDHFLDLMASSPHKAPITHQQESPSNLSVRGRDLMEDVTQKTLRDKTNLDAIQELCPQWKENVVFAMAQREQTDLSNAIENVKSEKKRLEDLKIRFLEALGQRMSTLNFFEETLKVSSTRLSTNHPDPNLRDQF